MQNNKQSQQSSDTTCIVFSSVAVAVLGLLLFGLLTTPGVAATEGSIEHNPSLSAQQDTQPPELEQQTVIIQESHVPGELYVNVSASEETSVYVEIWGGDIEQHSAWINASPGDPGNYSMEISEAGLYYVQIHGENDSLESVTTDFLGENDDLSIESPVPEGAIPGEQVQIDQEYYGLNGSSVFYLFSQDDEQSFNLQVDPGSTYNPSTNEVDSSNLTDAEARNVTIYDALNRDVQIRGLPDDHITWNVNNWAAFESNFNTNDSVSQYPSGTETKDTEFIKDAHASIYQIFGSTTVHQSEGSTVTHIPRTGVMAGLVDYRTNLPSNDLSGESGEMYSIVDSRIVTSCTVLGPPEDCGQVYNSTAGDHTPGMIYTISSEDPPEQISLVSEIEVEVNVISLNASGCAKDLANLSVTASCLSTSEEVVVDSVRVSDTMEVTSPNVVGDVEGAVYPDGTKEFEFDFHTTHNNEPTSLWSSISINGTAITSQWSYTPWRDTSWDIMEMGGQSGEYNPIATPVGIHAIPAGPAEALGPGVTANEVIYSEDIANHSNPGPSLPENVVVETINDGGEYQEHGEIVIRHEQPKFAENYSLSEVGMDDLAAYGIDGSTAGNDEILLQTDEMREIQQAEVDLEIVEENEGNVTVEVQIQNSAGQPINLQESGRGYIEVNGREIEPGADGQMQLNFPASSAGLIEATYHPEEWHNLNASVQAYTGDQSTVYREGPYSGNGFLIYMIEVLIIPVMLLGCSYAWYRRSKFLSMFT